MIASRFSARLIATAALFAAASSQAAVVASTATNANSFAALVAGGIDTFSDLNINNVLTGPLARTAGGIAYNLSAPSGFFVNTVASFISPGTTIYNESITYSGFAPDVRAFGGNFLSVDTNGEPGTQVPLTVTVTDIFGAFSTLSITGGAQSGPSGTSGFKGWISDSAIASVTVTITTPNTNAWASVDNTVLSAVPEASTWMMMLAGGAAVLRLGTRRRA
jgi:hypothetical protein